MTNSTGKIFGFVHFDYWIIWQTECYCDPFEFTQVSDEHTEMFSHFMWYHFQYTTYVFIYKHFWDNTFENRQERRMAWRFLLCIKHKFVLLKLSYGSVVVMVGVSVYGFSFNYIKTNLYQFVFFLDTLFSKDMEDAHTHILSMKEDKDAAFFAVFDGHGGLYIQHFEMFGGKLLWQNDKMISLNPAFFNFYTKIIFFL